jgi:ketosteroid isomerase-like protein
MIMPPRSPRRLPHLIACIIALSAASCARPATPGAGEADAGIDSLNARLVQAYRDRDPRAYGALYTDTALFEWPAFGSVRGPTALGAMAANNWKAQRDVDLRLKVANRRISGNHATEFGAFEQSWRDSGETRMVEYGRYVTALVRGADGTWRMDRFFGFEDSTRQQSPRP